MGFFESLFYVIWRGIAIGIMISAPMGPVGILCIQRTLDKGKRQGFYTGVGASLSDLFYCILTGFGLSFIEDFLEKNSNIIQLVGSAVLIGFSIYLFRKNPVSSLRRPSESVEGSPKKSILGGFLFTFSNPLILFLIIGLFARFNFTVPEISLPYYIIGFACIFLGALIWWKFVTFSVDKLRAHFNLRSMWLINRVIGVIILLFAIVGIVTGTVALAQAEEINWNKGRGYAPFVHATEDGIRLNNEGYFDIEETYTLDELSSDFELRFRANNFHAHPSRRYPYVGPDGIIKKTKNPGWGFFIFNNEGDTLTFLVGVTEKEERIEGQSQALITARYSCSRNPELPVAELEQVTIPGVGLNSHTGKNMWQLKASEEEIILSGGNVKQGRLAELPPLHGEVAGFGFFSCPGADLLISDIKAKIEENGFLQTGFGDVEELKEHFKESGDLHEGFWVMFDRDLEESYLKPGGEYTVAIVKRDSVYEIIYLEGAIVNSRKWHPGMLKGILKPTHFYGVFDCIWIDAEGNRINNGIKAQTVDGQTFQIQFPYQNSSFRLRKVAPEKIGVTQTRDL